MRNIFLPALLLVPFVAGCLGDDLPADEPAQPPGIYIDGDDEAPPTSRDAPPQSTPPPVRGKIISDEEWEWEPSAAIDPTDSDHYVIAYRHSSHDTMTVRSTFDAGRTWHEATVPVGDDASGAAAEWDHSGDPVVFFSPEGDLYIGGIAGFRTDPPTGAESVRHGRSIFVAASPDGGRSIDSPDLVSLGGGTYTTYSDGTEHSDDFRNLDRPWFAAGPDGLIVAAWNELGHNGQRTVINGQATVPYDGNDFQVAVSTDAGTTWDHEQTLDHGGWPAALVREDGTLVVARGSFLNTKITFWTSSDGASWSEMDEHGTGRDHIDLIEHEGDLLVASSTSFQGAFAPTYFRLSDAGNKGPYIFATGHDLRSHVNIASDPTGGFWTTWTHTNGTLNLARFADPDSPWPTERHVVASIDPRLNQYGDYVDTLAVGDRLYVAWNDMHEEDRVLRVSVY